jgi:predicted phage terminase large subunit-like protein
MVQFKTDKKNIKKIVKAKENIVRPNEGPQTEFLASTADIVVFGGSAGCGKSYALLLEALRNTGTSGFQCAIFRRQSKQVTSGGGLWDTSQELYPLFGAEARTTPRHQWTFPSGAKIVFDHLQYDKSVHAWDGSQLAMVGFDELQHFTEAQFFYMLSRNRSTCGVKSYMRATCNPDPDSFLVKLLAWWIDKEGYPIKERSGVVRWLVRRDGKIEWFDSYDDVVERYPVEIATQEVMPKSFTFIHATLDDNPKLLELDPSYKGNLNAMFEYERLRLLKGNWFARPQAGELFKTYYWQFLDAEELPTFKHIKGILRYWDRAGTLPSDVTPDPDYTAGCLMAIDDQDRIIIFNMKHDRLEPHDVELLIKRTAKSDGVSVSVWLERDPGSAGKQEVAYYIRNLAGYDVHARQKRTSKLTYWRPLAAQAKAGNVYLVRGSWNDAFIGELAAVTDGTQKGHDDQADAASGAFMVLASLMHDTYGDSAVLAKHATVS